MGVYDVIRFKCSCGLPLEAQTKSGECNLEEYTYPDVPEDVAEDANRHAPFTCDCGKSWRFTHSIHLTEVS